MKARRLIAERVVQVWCDSDPDEEPLTHKGTVDDVNKFVDRHLAELEKNAYIAILIRNHNGEVVVEEPIT